MIDFKALRALVSCKDFAQREMRVDRNGKRAVCPFHPGATHYNLQLFDDGFRCHVCGEGGDIIALAGAVWGLEPKEAAAKLNDVFNLGMDADVPNRAAIEAKVAARRRELQEAAARRRSEAEAWSEACEAERRAQEAIENFSIEDAETDNFTRALQRLCAAQQRCDVLASARGC